MTGVIDCDQHLFEQPTTWVDHIDPKHRDLALRIAPDDLGHHWVWFGDQPIELVFRQVPGDTAQVGEQVAAVRAARPAEHGLDELHPPVYTDPAARLRHLDAIGADAAVLFPNYGLGIEGPLEDQPVAQRENMVAWNRWAASVATDGGGRLLPVAHLTLRDPTWAVAQIEWCAEHGLRGAMVAPALAGGRRLSHPELDPVWSAFEATGVAPVFHVGSFRKPFDPAWFEGDPDELNPVLSSVFLGTAPALALADLAVNGVLAAHPDLRVGVMELSAVWLPMFLLTLDGAFDFHARFNGAPLRELELRPSEYVRRQVRVGAFSYEGPARLLEQCGDVLMACSDFPHSEGSADLLPGYAAAGLTPQDHPGLFGGNLAWLLGLA